jgi:hypothetical protein
MSCLSRCSFAWILSFKFPSVVDLAGSNFFTLNAKEKMQMQVTMPNGEMTPYDMITSDNIGNLKARIQAKAHLDRQLIKINYNGEE